MPCRLVWEGHGDGPPEAELKLELALFLVESHVRDSLFRRRESLMVFIGESMGKIPLLLSARRHFVASTPTACEWCAVDIEIRSQ